MRYSRPVRCTIYDEWKLENNSNSKGCSEQGNKIVNTDIN